MGRPQGHTAMNNVLGVQVIQPLQNLLRVGSDGVLWQWIEFFPVKKLQLVRSGTHHDREKQENKLRKLQWQVLNVCPSYWVVASKSGLKRLKKRLGQIFPVVSGDTSFSSRLSKKVQFAI